MHEPLTIDHKKYCLGFQSQGLLYWECDLATALLSPSPSLNKFLGYSSDEKIALNEWYELIHPDEQLEIKTLYAKLQNQEIEHYTREFRIYHQNNRYVWLREYGTLLNNTIVGMHAIIEERDTTVFKNHIQPLLEYSDCVVWEINKKGYYTYLNDKTLYGYSKHALMGKRIFDLMPKTELKRLLPIYRDLFKKREKISNLFNVKRHHNGQSIYVITHASPFFDHDGQFLGYRGIDRDITKEVQLEKKLNQEKLIRTQREAEFELLSHELINKRRELHDIGTKNEEDIRKGKAEFFASIDNDIQDPLHNILNTLEVALDEELHPHKREHLEKIKVDTHSLLRLSNNLVDMHRIELGTLTIQREKFDLLKTIDKMMHFIDLQTQAKNLSVDISYGRELKRYYWGDSRRLTQVLNNLIGYFIYLAPNRSTIELFIDRIDADKVHFGIRAMDIELSPKEQEMLFTPFYQVTSAPVLGLNVAKHLIELMKGKIHAQSQEEYGSSFIFEIGIEEIKEKPKDEEDILLNQEILDDLKHALYTLQGSHILIAEAQNNLLPYLEHTGIHIDIVRDAKEALQIYQDHPTRYELLLINAQIPLLEGVALCHQIRLSGAKVPIVFVTQNLDEAQNQEIDEYLPLPIDEAQLYKTLLKFIPSKTVVTNDRAKTYEDMRLPHFDTLDTQLGLSYCQNNPTLYIDMLHNFRAEYYGIYFEVLEKKRLIETIEILLEDAKSIGATQLVQAALHYAASYDSFFLSKLYNELHALIEEIEEKLIE